MNGAFQIEDLGIEPYQRTYERQLRLLYEKKNDPTAPDRLILVEHPDVYTAGRGSKVERIPEETFFIERGGKVTFHNPGQIVFYPILRLEDSERDLHGYLRRLEDVLIQVLSDFSLKGDRRDGATGVWIEGSRKIASIGVAVSGWVTYHGCALNVNNSLEGFQRIDPCGFESSIMTSVERELGRPIEMARVKKSIGHHFCSVFAKKIR